MVIYQDREQAAELLAESLAGYQGQNPLVLGIPRGAMPMAEIIAEHLGGELGAVLVHKIPAPGNEEFAIASIGLSGRVYRNLDLDSYGISESYLESEAERQLARLRERQRRFRLEAPRCEGRVVIVVDDGIATGATAVAAVKEVRSLKPKRLVLAAAVIASETAERLRGLVDELVVLAEPELFWSVGQFFADFTEVTDEDVEEVLARHRRREVPRAAG